MRYRIGKAWTFAASHRIENLPDEHKCSRLHGHNYEVEVVLEDTDLNLFGFIRDFGDLGFMEEIVAALDHRHLNDVLGFSPTAERIAAWWLTGAREQDERVVAVRVRESGRTWAEAWWDET